VPASAKRVIAGTRSDFRFSRRHFLNNEDMIICEVSAEESRNFSTFTDLAIVTECNVFAAADRGLAAVRF
jgi:hypothetical protein